MQIAHLEAIYMNCQALFSQKNDKKKKKHVTCNNFAWHFDFKG